jgi:hypothetical protein
MSVLTSGRKIITYKVLESLFDLPLANAAKILGVGTTFFKQKCREYGIERWPYRQRQSIEQLEKNTVLNLFLMLWTKNNNTSCCSAETDTDTEM